MALMIKRTGLEEYLDPNGGAWLKMLILGDHGAGKTRSAGTGYPKPIIADCEHGLMSVTDVKVPYAAITSSADMDALLMYAKADTMKPAGKREYETFVLDTIDSLQRVLKTERLRKERRDNMTGPDWGWLGTKMQSYIEQLLNLNMNVLVHVHLKNEKDKDSDGNEVLSKAAALEGALATSVYRDFDLIGMMENSWVAEDGERVLKRQIRWHAEPKYSMLRDRSGRLPRFTDVNFDATDYEQIFDSIFGDIAHLTKGEQLAELTTEEDGLHSVPDPVPNGGPVPNATMPRAPAKKAAKKAAPKKSTASAQSPEPVSTRVTEKEAAVAAQPADAAPAVSGSTEPEAPEGVDTTPMALAPPADPSPPEPVPGNVRLGDQTPEQLDETMANAKAHTPAATSVPDPEMDKAQAVVEDQLGGEVIETAVGQVDTTTGEVVAPPPPVAPVEAAPTHVCGDTKPGLTPKVEGCGKPLTEANNAKVQIARLKYQVDLCEDCFTKNKKG